MPYRLPTPARFHLDRLFPVCYTSYRILRRKGLALCRSTDDAEMAQRLLEYNILATREHGRKVLSCVIYLRPDKTIVESPLIWALPNAQEVLRFHFLVIKLWEILAENILRTGLVGLLPLLPLTKGGARHEVVDEMVAGLAAAEERRLLPLAKAFATLMFKDESDREWLERSFAMYKNIIRRREELMQDEYVDLE